MRDLILASSSPYRAELLQRLQIPFRAHSPAVDETPLPGESPDALVTRLSVAKARAVAGDFPAALVIGSDQVAVCADQVLGKPGTDERARAQLQSLSGQSVDFLTGLCVLDAASGRQQVTLVPTRVRFRTLNAREITAYVQREQPLNCAGAFKSEGLGIALFERFEGEDPNALIGLPLIALCGMLRNAGLDVLG